MDSDKGQDESVLIAASALDDMRKGAQQPGASGQAAATGYSEGFVGRVTGIPLVNSALRVYEQGKASSRVVKYGAQMVESGVRSISKPVINRLPVDVNQLDEFACRQLDRFDRYRRPSIAEGPTSPSAASPSPTPTSSHADSTMSPPTSPRTSPARGRSVNGKGKSPEPEEESPATIREKPKRRGSSWLTARSPFAGPAPPPPSDPKQDAPDPGQPPPSNDRQVAQRSRWHTMLLEAGGLSAALSEESMKRLKYCLEWLMFATSHIDGQILILRDFIASLQPLPPGQERPNGRPAVSPQHLKTLTAARRDIVHTVRQVVDVVSRYAGGALPEPARAHVRGFILQLPQRWAKKARSGPGRDDDVELDRVGGAGDKELSKDKERERESVAAAATGGGAVRRGRRAGHRERGAGNPSNPPSRASSPIGRRTHSRHRSGQYQQGAEGEAGPSTNGEAVSANTAIVAAQKILTLATESLDMMRGVTGVVKDSLDKADAWVGRFRAVGIERGRSASQSGELEEPTSPRSPTSPQSSSTATAFGKHRHTRNTSDLSELDELDLTHSLHRRRRAGSIDSDIDLPPSPFFGGSSTSFSSSNGSSIPSTPGASFVIPSNYHHQGVYGGGYANGMPGPGGSVFYAPVNGGGGGAYGPGPANAPSPGASLGLGFGGMTLDSRGGSVTSTPRSVVRDLEDERAVENVKVDEVANVKEVKGGELKVVGMEVEDGEDATGVGVGKMDVDA